MTKNKFKPNTGLTLIEILIGIIVSSIMMAAIYTTYSVVNTTYNQVLEKAKVSRASRDLIELLIRDARMAGYKYYLGTNNLGFPSQSNLQFITGTTSIFDSHDPIIIEKDTLGHDIADPNNYVRPTKINLVQGQADACCDKIYFVYDDFDHTDDNQPFKRYKVTYFADIVFDGTPQNPTNQRYAVFKTKIGWIQSLNDRTGNWDSGCPTCYDREMIKDYVEDMEFIPLDKNGRVISPYPSPKTDDASKNLYKVRAIDMRIAFVSEKPFFRFERGQGNPRQLSGFSRDIKSYTDRNLRDSVVVTVHTRNVVEKNIY